MLPANTPDTGVATTLLKALRPADKHVSRMQIFEDIASVWPGGRCAVCAHLFFAQSKLWAGTAIPPELNLKRKIEPRMDTDER